MDGETLRILALFFGMALWPLAIMLAVILIGRVFGVAPRVDWRKKSRFEA